MIPDPMEQGVVEQAAKLWDYDARIECSHGVDTRSACWRCVSHAWVSGASGVPYYECVRFPKRLQLCDWFQDKWPACVANVSTPPDQQHSDGGRDA